MHSEAKEILKETVQYQLDLSASSFRDELIDGAVPILWYGRPEKRNVVTIGTNPTSKKFYTTDQRVLANGMDYPFREVSREKLSSFLQDEQALHDTIDYFLNYFEEPVTSREWFGKPYGAKLEGFLNGMDYSFYSSPLKCRAVHVDYFPIPTRHQMSQIRNKEPIFSDKGTKKRLHEILSLLEPSSILLLGKKHCERFSTFLDHDIHEVPSYPSARFQRGVYQPLGIPVVGLHFKPSEMFLGLGGGKDRHGLSHGSYGRRDVIRFLGETIGRTVRKSGNA
ncbi:hypothetical protein EQV77_16185 [Halobacillus fulvus]|nr:hypothetical protein EQV77_16185 [Halobacillus fulvus]